MGGGRIRRGEVENAKGRKNAQQEIIADEVPMIPMYDEIMINAVRDNVRGYRPRPRFIINWEEIYIV